MKTALTLLWLLAPIALLALHFGPGQRYLGRDKAADRIERALASEREGDWDGAFAAYEESLALLPEEDKATRNRVKLAGARTRICKKGELVEAMTDLENLLDGAADGGADPGLEREARGLLAATQYAAAWLMRLEGADTKDWTEQTENARQNFRYLAERELRSDDPESAQAHQRNLEATIRLARMDLSVLKGLPLPEEAQGSRNGDVSDKMAKKMGKGKGKGKGKQPGQGEQPGDAREKGKGAGEGKRPEGVGS